MDKLKKIAGIKIREKWVAVLAVIVMLGLLVPLFRLALYAVPYYDDYLHVKFAKSFINAYGGFSGWLEGVLYTVKSQYYAWQGTYSTQFIVSASPLVLDDKYYSYVVIAVLVIFLISVMAFVLMTTRRLMKITAGARWIMAVVFATTLVELIYTAQQGIFWYNGEVHYTLMHGLMLLMIGIAVEILYAESYKKALILSVPMAILGIIVAGSNFVTILQGLLVLLTIAGLGMLCKNKKTFCLIVPTCIYAYGFYINVIAPGNDKRAQNFQGYGVLKSILYSFKSAWEEFGQFTGLIMIVVMLLIIPVVWNAVIKMDYQFKLPGLVTLYSVCLYATGFTSSYYGMGSAGVPRAWVVIKFTLQLMLFINEIYWIGWFVKRRQKKTEVKQMEHYLLYYIAICLMMLVVFAITPNKVESFSSYGAYYYIHSGEAYNFYQQYQERMEVIENSGGVGVIQVEPYYWQPSFLCMGDLSTDPNAATNRALAEWYGKEAIYVVIE